MNHKEESLWKRGQEAFESKNYGYVLILCQQLLRSQPGMIECRKMLRAASIALHGVKPGISKPDTAVKLMQIQPLVGTDPAEALVRLEAVLADEPLHLKANQTLFEAARALELADTAVFAAETALQGHPKDAKVAHWVGDVMMAYKNYERAHAVFSLVQELEPADFEARKKANDALTLQSIVERDETDFRNNLRNHEDTARNADMERMAGTSEQLHARVNHLMAEHNESPAAETAVKIGQLLDQAGEAENALLWYESARELNPADSSILKPLTELKERIGRKQLLNLQSALEQATEPADRSAIENRIAELKAEETSRIIEECRRQVIQNPTDKEMRLKLGEWLLSAGRSEEALPHLQKARETPALQKQAMLLLGQCYSELEMYDLAIEEFEEAIGLIDDYSEMKKELLYHISKVYRNAGRQSDSLSALKRIYKHDCSYRDVAQLEKSSYSPAELVS